jgi:hypothetical protein
LADAIRKATPPFTIGVFGRWGVGKTTITKDYLARLLDSEPATSVPHAYFDVWKYEGDSLRRQFLREIADQLQEMGHLDRSFDVDRDLQDLLVDVGEVVDEGLRWSRPRVVAAAIRAGLFAGVAFVAIRLLEGLGWLAPGDDRLLLAVLTGAIAAIGSEMRNVVVVGERSLVRRRLDSPELFETRFLDVLDAVTADRVVIVVDNLDRCSPDRIAEVLSTIKTFLESSGRSCSPIFVVPCDDEAIRRYLSQRSGLSESDAEEYLRKFFNLSFRLTPILNEEIRHYIEEQVAELSPFSSLSDSHRNEIVQMMGVAFRANPRRVKQFLNVLIAKLSLIRQREVTGAINPPISHEVSFLAKLSIIEDRWPEFYQAMSLDPRGFDSVTQKLVGLERDVPERLNVFLNDSELAGFLRATRRTASNNLRAFVRLKLSPSELQIPNYADLRAALVDGRIDGIPELIEGETSSRYASAALTIMDEEVASGYMEAALNVLDALVRVRELGGRELAEELAERIYSNPSLRSLLPAVSPTETIEMLGLANSDSAESLIADYLQMLEGGELEGVPQQQRPAWQTDVVKGLRSLDGRLQPSQHDDLRRMANGELVANIPLLLELSHFDDGAKRFLDEPALTAVIAHFDSSTLELDDRGDLVESAPVRIWLESAPHASPGSVALFVQKATELLAPGASASEPSVLTPILSLLAQSGEALTQAQASEEVDALARAAISRFDELETFQRWLLPVVLSLVYEGLSPNVREEAHGLVGKFAQELPRDVGAFFSYAARIGVERVPEQIREVLITRLAERFSTSTNREEQGGIAGIFVTNARAVGWEQVRILYQKPIATGNFDALTGGLDPYLDTLRRDQPEVLERTLDSLIQEFPASSPELQRRALETSVAYALDFTEEHRLGFRDRVLALIRSDDASARKHGLEALDLAEAEGVLDDEQRGHIAEQITIWLMSRSDAIDESYRSTLARVSKDAALMSEAAVENLVGLFQGQFSRGPSHRLLASEHLMVLPLGPDRLDQVVQELIHWIRQEGDSAVREQLIRRVSEMGRDKRTRAWKTVEAFLDGLRKGDEQDQALASELLEVRE